VAWIYLAESGASALPYRPGSDRSPTVKTTNTLSPSFFQEWQKEICQTRQSGTTCKRSPEKCCRQSTLFTADSPARISALLDMGLAWAESEADFLRRSSGWPKKSDHSSYFLKTCPPYVLADSMKLGKNWPGCGMIVDGILFPLRKSERPILESDGSYSPNYPTPRVCSGLRSSGMNRSEYYKIFATPTATSYGTNRGGGAGRVGKVRPSLSTQVGGALNPTWVEWLQGYPLEWTGLEDSVIPWFQSKREKRLSV
jgi:hypothetical protein